MPTKEQMTVNERRKYLKLMKVRYVAARRQERSQLLTEMQEVTGLHRKSLTRLMQTANLERKKRQKPRSRTYGPEVERVGGAGVGKPGLHLCGAADPKPVRDGAAPRPL